MNNNQDIPRLLDRYLAGITDNAEEVALRSYFATASDIPEEWQVYRALFGYVDSERMGAVQSLSTTPQESQERHGYALRLRPKHLWTAVAAAAIVAITMICWPKSETMAYAVIDGKVCTAQNEVKAEALNALATIQLEDDGEAFSALDMMKK